MGCNHTNLKILDEKNYDMPKFTMATAGLRSLAQVARSRWAVPLRAASNAALASKEPSIGTFHGRHREALAAGMVQNSAGIVEGHMSSCVFSLTDGVGSLQAVLEVFKRHGVNMTHIESRPSKATRKYEFHVDFDGVPGQAHVDGLLSELRNLSASVSMLEPIRVPWFPTSITDIDHFSTKTLDAGAELEADHPGFNDKVYRQRRHDIVERASKYKHGQKIPNVEYTKDEIDTWAVVYNKLRGYTDQFAVSQYKEIMPQMEKHCGYGERSIPQLQDISDWLEKQTGFILRPVGGLLSARDFLNALAFRVFFSTQYIRHHTRPLYTPEPDVVHELMGHAPMFADPDFADFSHEVGLASLGASDEDIKKLATCYWFSVEFGLCMQDGARRAYGAGLLSSFGELEYSCAPYRPAGGEEKYPEYRPWEPEKAAVQPYPITTYQPVYYVAESLADAKARMRAYCERLNKGFNVSYDHASRTVSVDRALLRGQYTVTLQK